MWVQFCKDFGTNLMLSGLSSVHRLRYLELFGKLYSNGTTSKSGKPVRAHTVETALGDIGALFTDMGEPDPRLHDGRYLAPLKSWLVSLHKQDPSSASVMPCSFAILRELHRLPLNGIESHARGTCSVNPTHDWQSRHLI